MSENILDIIEHLQLDEYVVVRGDNSRIIGIMTIRDYFIKCTTDLKHTIEKPRIQLGTTIIEAHELMKLSGSDYLPVFENGDFVGVLSIRSLTERLIYLSEQAQVNYQKTIHDLRNPIANIQGIIGIMSNVVRDEESREMLELSTQSSKHAMDILEDLLHVEIDKNKPIVQQETEMNEFYSDCIKEQIGTAYQKNIQLKTQFVGQSIFKLIDRKQFKRAVQNIISNAIKFSAPGSVVKISSMIIDDTIRLKVVDTGVGIAKDLHKAIFKKFSTAQRPGTNGEASTGLGLYFTKQCIEKHKGIINLKSEIGEGTEFNITI